MSRMPDTEMTDANQRDTDAWNFLNCDLILGTYPDTYIKPLRKFNKESFGNLKLTLENDNSLRHRCPPNSKRPLPFD